MIVSGRKPCTASLAAVFLLLAASPLAAEKSRGRDGSGSPEASRQTLERVGRSYSFVREPELLNLVKEVGANVARGFRAPADRYEYYILDDPSPNAFTTPSGDIFIFAGELARLRSEDELAAVLAHEMAHKEADHFSVAARKGALVAIPTLAALVLSRGEEAVVAGAVAVAQAYQLHFSREMEEEADLMAVNALRKTAYDPLGMVGALEVMERADKLMPSEVPDHLSTHPPLELRKAGLESILGRPMAESGYRPAPGKRWGRFRAVLLGLMSEPSELVRKWESMPEGAENPWGHHLNGLALLRAERPREALKELQAALPGLAEDPLLLADLGEAAYLAGDSAARDYLERARKQMPDYSYPSFYLAQMEREAGRTQQASLLYQQAIDGRPEIPEAYHQYGTLLGEKGKEGEAAFHMGVAALLNGEFKQALPLLKEAQRQLGQNPFWRDRIENRLSVLR